MKRYSVTLIVVALFAGFASATANSNEVVFQIGYPDGRAAEFRKWIKWEDFFEQENPVVCDFTVGKSLTRDWLPWHNSTREWHAAGRSFTGRIHFNSPKAYDVPLYLVVGTCFGHPTEPSLINVTLNGTAVQERSEVDTVQDLDSVLGEQADQNRKNRLVVWVRALSRVFVENAGYQSKFGFSEKLENTLKDLVTEYRSIESGIRNG